MIIFFIMYYYLSQVVDCQTCGGSLIARGLSKPSSKRERFSTDVASVMKSKAPLAAAKAVVAGSPTLAGLAMPKERNSTPSNQRRRNSTLKAQLAKSSSQQRHRHGQGNSPKLTDFLTSSIITVILLYIGLYIYCRVNFEFYHQSL